MARVRRAALPATNTPSRMPSVDQPAHAPARSGRACGRCGRGEAGASDFDLEVGGGALYFVEHGEHVRDEHGAQPLGCAG